MADMIRGRKWDLVGLRNLWFAISLLFIAPGMVAYFVHGGLNKGIDFTGGGLVTYQLQEPVTARGETDALGRVRQAVADTGIEAQFQFAGSAGRTDQLLLRTRIAAGKDADRVLSEQKAALLPVLQQIFPGIHEIGAEMVSGVVSKELIQRAILAVLVGCIFILFWIRLRYPNFRWSFCALIALLHDVLFLIGVFALTRKEVNSPFVAAALTVVGFSVHDTIIIFDRIRENLRLRKGDTFAETANISLLETMPRSINTVLTVELVLLALYFLGGASLRDFTFAMIIGITIGAYSSIFNAAQLLVVMQGRADKKLAAKRTTGRPVRELAERPAATPRTRPIAPRPVEATASLAADEGEEDALPESTGALSAAARKKQKAARKRKRRF